MEQPDSRHGSESPSGDGARPQRASRWYYSIWSVLAALFLVLGPVALPLLWRSPHFSLFWKWVLTLLVLGMLAAMVVSGIHVYDGVMELLRVQELPRS